MALLENGRIADYSNIFTTRCGFLFLFKGGRVYGVDRALRKDAAGALGDQFRFFLLLGLVEEFRVGLQDDSGLGMIGRQGCVADLQGTVKALGGLGELALGGIEVSQIA